MEYLQFWNWIPIIPTLDVKTGITSLTDKSRKMPLVTQELNYQKKQSSRTNFYFKGVN